MLRRLALLVPVACVLTVSTHADAFDRFYGFGDSSIDSGWYRNPADPPIGNTNFNLAFPTAVAEGAGKPTSSPGLMSSEVLAALLGLTAIPADEPGGTNFATSGARANLTNGPGDGLFQGAVPTVTQISNYLAGNGGVADPGALYLISSGGNDVGFASNNIVGLGNQLAYLNTAAGDLVAGVTTLHNAGGRYIVVPNLPEDLNLALQPLRADYDTALWTGLAAAGINFVPADVNAVRLAIVADPASFGFQFISTADPACQQPAGIGSAWALLCATTVSPLVAPNADLTHLFADDQHLATAGQKILGDYFYSLVAAPSELSMLAATSLSTRETEIGGIENQIAVSRRSSHGFDIWATGDLSKLEMSDGAGFAAASGTPWAVTIGADAKLPNGWLAGAAVSLDQQSAGFDTGGSFAEREVAASLYADLTAGPFWLDLIGTYGWLNDSSDRIVPIGITLQSNKGSTNGSDASFAATGGFDFTNGPVTEGPVLGARLQQAAVDGFTEAGGFTSLAVGKQTRDSAVSEVGYRAEVKMGAFDPFIQAEWDHEFASSGDVSAALTSTSAPGFSLPAVQLGQDWAEATLGTTATLGQNLTALASFTGDFGRNGVMTYGGEVGLNAGF